MRGSGYSQTQLTEKSSDNVFSKLILKRGPMVISKKTIVFQDSRGGGGSNIFQGEGGEGGGGGGSPIIYSAYRNT